MTPRAVRDSIVEAVSTPEEPGDWHASLSDDDFLAVSDLFEPVTQVGPQLCDCNVHSPSVQLRACDLYMSVCAPRAGPELAQVLGSYLACRRLRPTGLRRSASAESAVAW